MFTQLKKDYYSVNANISLSPVRNQSMVFDDPASMINSTNQQMLLEQTAMQ